MARFIAACREVELGASETGLAKFAREYPSTSIPDEITHLAKRCIMNYCGVALYGSIDPSINILPDLFESDGESIAASKLEGDFTLRRFAQRHAVASAPPADGIKLRADEHRGSGLRNARDAGLVQQRGYASPPVCGCLPALNSVLAGNDEDTQVFAAQVLAEMGPKAKPAVPALVQSVRKVTWEPPPKASEFTTVNSW